MPKKKPDLRETLLANQSGKPRSFDELDDELREACLMARQLWRDGEARCILQLWKTLKREFGYPFGRSSFTEWLKGSDDG